MITPAYTATLLSPTEALVQGPEALWQWREDQSILVPGHEYMPRFRSGEWDGLHIPGQWCRQKGDVWQMRCSRGLLGRLQQTTPVEVDKYSFPFPLPPPHPNLAKLHDYQCNAFIIALDRQWGRIALATNAGKGAIIALLAEFAMQHEFTTLILCDELSVFDALGDPVTGEIKKWADLVPGLLTRNTKKPPTDPVVLAMVPTLARRLSSKDKEKAALWRTWVGEREMVLLDEADKAIAPTWRKILANAKGSRWRLGFSGTFPGPKEKPYDDLRLDELMGPILIEAKNKELIDRKVSAIPQVKLHGFDVTTRLLFSPKKWWEMAGASRRQLVFEQAVMTNVERHHFLLSLIRPDTPTAIVVNRVAHGHALAQTIPQSVFLDGSADMKRRQAVLADFQEGKIQILIVTKILDRGTNRLGHATDILFASGEGSSRQTLQRIGRGLRRTGGKEFLRLVDVIDRVDLDSVPTRQGFLTKAADYIHTAARKRIRLYQDEGFEVELVK